MRKPPTDSRDSRAAFLARHPLPHPAGCFCIVCVGVRQRQKVDEEIARWMKEHPRLESRLERARSLVDSVIAVLPLPDGDRLHLVAGVTGQRGRFYIVRIGSDGASDCSCPDAGELWASHCKHQLAVLIRVAVNPLSASMPLDARAFEDVIREWFEDLEEDPDAASEQLQLHGLFAMRMLLDRVTRFSPKEPT